MLVIEGIGYGFPFWFEKDVDEPKDYEDDSTSSRMCSKHLV